ncbi:unnamed protein product [Allacma fusca]|uniref:Uncharacterized protein n=1 Tax=Allacma fusca TaxID=39272 RepID=A0A8J2JUK5_9HEXA|nr:unnamed protein product [Allacma fusca]
MIRRNYCNSYLEVSFENETNIEAIISLLLRGRFLNKLKFTNINVEKQVLDNPSRSLADYQLPFLTELKFYGSPCLTSDDYSLLHWINKRVTIPHLQSFAFIGDIRSSLKCLSLAGVFLKNIGNHVSHELHITTAASNVSRHLRSLSTSLDNPAENFSALLNCIQSNWRCLRSIEITPVINFTTDVDNYQLAVPGRVRNIHLLPASLQSLEIWADRYEQTDLDLFAMRFESLRISSWLFAHQEATFSMHEVAIR